METQQDYIKIIDNAIGDYAYLTKVSESLHEQLEELTIKYETSVQQARSARNHLYDVFTDYINSKGGLS